jgi:hypothetical protein
METHVLWSKGIHRDIIMDLPLINDLSVLQVHPEQRVGVITVLKDQVAILSMEHDLLGAKELAPRGLHLGNSRGELEIVV